MHNRSNRFDVTLSLQEVVVLFFVMVALFTGLLFFGYRVGYLQSSNATKLQPRPASPQEESPGVEQRTPERVEPEPEIRLENTPSSRPELLPMTPSKPGNPDMEGHKPLANNSAEPAPRPCKAESYLSFLQKSLPMKHRFFERLAGWARVPPDDAVLFGEETVEQGELAVVSDSELFAKEHAEPDAVDCGPAIDLRALRSVPC